LKNESAPQVWDSAPLEDPADDPALAAIRKEEHLLACEETIALIAETYGRDWDERERHIKSQAWHLALGSLSPEQVKTLILEELQERTNPFPPVPADLIARHTGEAWTQNEDGKVERVVIANPQAYEPLKPTQNELIERGLIPALPPGPDEPDYSAYKPGGAEHAKFKRRWTSGMANEGEWQPVGPEERALLKVLSDALFSLCDMKTFSLKPRIRYEFACWLLGRFPISQWNPMLAREQWQLWQQEATQRAKEERSIANAKKDKTNG
jgi:hypothetical protein